MAITNPEALKFSNEKVRVLSDLMVSTYESCQAYRNEWDANTLGSIFPNQANEIVEDGYATDGRHQLTGQKVNALYTAAGDFMTWADTVVGGKTRIAWLRTMFVNGQPRF
jgi:hypothetical protein